MRYGLGLLQATVKEIREFAQQIFIGDGFQAVDLINGRRRRIGTAEDLQQLELLQVYLMGCGDVVVMTGEGKKRESGVIMKPAVQHHIILLVG